MLILQSAFGFAALIALAWAVSENRRNVRWRTVAAGALLQIALGFLLLKVPPIKEAFVSLNNVLLAIEKAAQAGTSFVFGYLGGGPLPFGESHPGASFVLAFRALPLILVVGALSALLFHWRVLPLIVKGFSRLLEKTMGVGGAVGVSASANVFVGMIEAPLFIRPYLKEMTRGELFAVMTAGMATIAGTVMFLYASFLSRAIPDALGQILIASIISAPAAITVAALMVPGDDRVTSGNIVPPQQAENSMDAVTKGTLQAVELLINIIAMLIVLVALVSLANQIVGLLPEIGGKPVTLQRILGVLMAPLVWLAGVPWPEAQTAGALMGTKTILNELIAYLDLAALPEDALSPRSRVIMTYALCGFANLGSLGIMIGGMGTMVPERRGEIVSLGFRSIVSGTLATLMTGAVVGMLWF
ncbi:MAG: nucleoside transporter C-terminal domain-containing protein [Nitrospirota bacterium]